MSINVRDFEHQNQYADIYRQYETLVSNNAPEFINAARGQAYNDFCHNGFPSLNDENYRHTDVGEAFAPDFGLNFNRIPTSVNPADVFCCDVPNMSTQLYFIVNDTFKETVKQSFSLPDGVFAGSMRKFGEKHPDIAARYYGKAAATDTDPIAALNTMLVQDGFVLYIPANVAVERPFQLVNVFRSNVDVMANRRMMIILEKGARAKLLVCDHTMDSVKCLANQVVEIFAAENATFDYYDLEESSTETTRFSSVYVNQDAGSNVLVDAITLNNGLTRNDFRIMLNGENAETTLCGMSVSDGVQHVDTYTHITHNAPRCRSNELFKNVLNNSSTGIFNGKILVLEKACKTEAYQTNRNLCLTREARMFGMPQLEIYTDDVRCSHGMATGQIDEQALFYMQARGISREEAKMMLSIAFTSDVIAYIRLDALKDRMRYLVEKRFRGELAQCRGCLSRMP
ncbi:MAG: Fe-S cluster assembly protein SufD [Tannerella sp.]|jgi:Fe-S cluster assembly protein SufD|nr:Fe-S cluster assembly protein SufD [Tannerella sp.]